MFSCFASVCGYSCRNVWQNGMTGQRNKVGIGNTKEVVRREEFGKVTS